MANININISSPRLPFHRRQHSNDTDISSNGSIRSSSSTDSVSQRSQKKKTASQCSICGKRLMKLAKWRNYLIVPCKCHHTFCKNCISERLQCRQKVMGEMTYDLMWTFPCPGSAQCGQELTVDWARGRKYSKNLVARDLGSASDDSWEQEEEEEEGGEEVGSVFRSAHDIADCRRHQYLEITRGAGSLEIG